MIKHGKLIRKRAKTRGNKEMKLSTKKRKTVIDYNELEKISAYFAKFEEENRPPAPFPAFFKAWADYENNCHPLSISN